MPRPTSKAQLLDAIATEHAALQNQLSALTPEQMSQPGVVGEWSVKDVLAHLTTWQRMFRDWYVTGKRGETPVTPAEGYTWREIPALNEHIYQKHKNDSLEDVQAAFAESHAATVALIERMENEEMFTPKVYKWTKSTTLGSYAVSATSSHYDWAHKEIRRSIKRLAG